MRSAVSSPKRAGGGVGSKVGAPDLKTAAPAVVNEKTELLAGAKHAHVPYALKREGSMEFVRPAADSKDRQATLQVTP